MCELYAGIDPGKTGALAIMGKDLLEVYNFKKLTRKGMHELFTEFAPNIKKAYIEKVWGLPRDTPTTAFRLGNWYGYAEMLLTALEIPHDHVAAKTWQTKLGCLTKGDKKVSKTKCESLFPKLSVTQANADAVLICEYGRRKDHGLIK